MQARRRWWYVVSLVCVLSMVAVLVQLVRSAANDLDTLENGLNWLPPSDVTVIEVVHGGDGTMSRVTVAVTQDGVFPTRTIAREIDLNSTSQPAWLDQISWSSSLLSCGIGPGYIEKRKWDWELRLLRITHPYLFGKQPRSARRFE